MTLRTSQNPLRSTRCINDPWIASTSSSRDPGCRGRIVSRSCRRASDRADGGSICLAARRGRESSRTMRDRFTSTRRRVPIKREKERGKRLSLGIRIPGMARGDDFAALDSAPRFTRIRERAENVNRNAILSCEIAKITFYRIMLDSR